MVSLKLFGAPGIVTANDVLTGPATQRHRLALITLLALTPAPGISRDKLLAYLWPERDTESARNLLKQGVHALRKALGEKAIHSGGDELWLDPDLVSVDVHEYEAALARGDHAAAISLYRGPFLDGFFLPEAPAFESWVSRERQRLADDYARALEAVAESAESRRDLVRAVDHWKARAAHDPYDSRVALRLMQALEAAGNPAGALHHATVHTQLLRSDFDVEPPPDVTALADRIRAHPNAHAEPSTAAVRAESAARAEVAASADRTPPTPARRSRRFLYGGAFALVAVVIATLWLRGRSAELADTLQPSIAVLPLANLSADSNDAVLADGITEELISMLASSGNARVIASTSAAAFRDRRVAVPAIADSLSVANVLEGTVQKVGARLRVNVRLIDGRDGSTRWSQAYDRPFGDVFSVQDEIARTVAGELGLRFDKDRQITRHKTSNAAAYQFYLRASDPLLLRGQAGIGKAEELFRQAIALDSAYAAAHAGMALVYVRRARNARDPGMPTSELLALAKQEAMTAVALDNDLAEAHYALAVVREAMLDLPAAVREIERAIELDPSRSVYRRRLAYMRVWEGRADLELADAQRALETDPLNPYAIAAVAGGLYGNRRYDEALQQIERIAAVQPPLQAYAFTIAQIHGKRQQWEQAIALLRPQAEAGDPLYQALLGFMLARAGQTDEARRVIADLTTRADRRAFHVAVVYVGLRDYDQAFAWLNRSIDDRSISSWIMGPTFDDLHDDPRFHQLRRRLGLHEQLPKLR